VLHRVPAIARRSQHERKLDDSAPDGLSSIRLPVTMDRLQGLRFASSGWRRGNRTAKARQRRVASGHYRRAGMALAIAELHKAPPMTQAAGADGGI